jgi:hypothetical protein
MQGGNAEGSFTETSSALHVVRFALVAEEDFVKLTLRRLFQGGDNGFVRFRYPHSLTRLSAGS